MKQIVFIFFTIIRISYGFFNESSQNMSSWNVSWTTEAIEIIVTIGGGQNLNWLLIGMLMMFPLLLFWQRKKRDEE